MRDKSAFAGIRDLRGNFLEVFVELRVGASKIPDLLQVALVFDLQLLPGMAQVVYLAKAFLHVLFARHIMLIEPGRRVLHFAQLQAERFVLQVQL